ncbi:FAST kinase domain-containing protein 3, mitochondrial isoform X2 [Gadus chalcogrammus]|uniref:FAST kinase domain-containing protein 3, mitochondrial isoform X2 n=1 Tax=Gadus chalcogrammus TaxID=1042646 RepID=UPI0024C4A583|nr:FAST kinase domain-containing protein 3, mitochondrial isoform X2 [Gadus chalcogrammus]
MIGCGALQWPHVKLDRFYNRWKANQSEAVSRRYGTTLYVILNEGRLHRDLEATGPDEGEFMALKAAQRLHSLGRAGRYIPRLFGNISQGDVCCASELRIAANRPIHHNCVLGRMGFSTITRDPSFLASGSVGLHKGSVFRFRLTQLHPPPEAEERLFGKRLAGCSSSRQVLRLLRQAETLSDVMAAGALHRVADLEQEGCSLRDPGVLEKDEVRSLCFQLEQDSGRLTDGGLVSALMACTRLFLDPWSTLVVRLVAESQERLDHGRMSVGELCTLGRALLALEGPGCGMLGQVMQQVQRRGPAAWSLAELLGVYRLLQDGAAEGGHQQALLHGMHAHALTMAPRMDAAAVSGLLGALVALEQSNATPLVMALCRQAVRHVGGFTDDQLSLVLGVLMHFGHSDVHFVGAMERHVPRVAFTARPETVTRVAQYFGQRNILSRPVFDALAESFVYRADDYDTGQVARQILPLGKLGYLPPNAGEVFGKVEGILHTRFSQFQPRTLLSLLHACTLVERFPVNFVSKVFKSYFLQELQEPGTAMDRLVLAQLTQLYMTVKLECPFYGGPILLPKYRVKSFLMPGGSLETLVDVQLYNHVRSGLVTLLGARTYFASKVLTPYCYTLDVEIKLDEEGYVLPASHNDYVHKRVALCIDGHKRFTLSSRQLLGREATKQRHLRLLGYQVVQIPFHEFEKLKNQSEVVEYLHNKIFPKSYRLSW